MSGLFAAALNKPDTFGLDTFGLEADVRKSQDNTVSSNPLLHPNSDACLNRFHNAQVVDALGRNFQGVSVEYDHIRKFTNLKTALGVFLEILIGGFNR